MTDTINDSSWLYQPCKPVDDSFIELATQHQANLTKPQGSLGMLETIAISYCGWQRKLNPRCEKIMVRIFAGDHGVCQYGISAFPQQVTTQMVENFVAGGAAINVLARRANADFNVINMGICSEIDDAPSLINTPLMAGTNDFTRTEAMSEQIMQAALAIGRDQVLQLNHDAGKDLFIGGDMGIGNTTSASAIYSLLLDLPPQTTVGQGAGVDKTGIAAKQEVLHRALDLHTDQIKTPLDVLQRVGGLEIAGLVGTYIACAQQGIPILVDGFITTAAALLANRINPASREWMMFAHTSAEAAHAYAVQSFDATPLLNLGMRLGEGTGSALAVPLIQSALALHNEMATFMEAGVSEG